MNKNFEWTYTEDAWMANSSMERCSTSLIIKEMQVKVIVRFHFTPAEWLQSKYKIKQVTLSVSEDVEKLELSYIGSGNVKWWSQFEKQFVSFLKKINIKLTLIPRNSTPRFLPKKNEKFMPTQRFIYKC